MKEFLNIQGESSSADVEIRSNLVQQKGTAQLEVEEAIQLAGTEGPYQRKIFLLLMIQFFCGAFFHTGLYFQLFDPGDHCFDNPQIAMSSPCASVDGATAVCNPEIQRSRVYQSEGLTVMYEFSLFCDRKWLAPTISVFYWMGAVLGTLYYSRVSEFRGRRKALIEAMSLSGVSAIAGSFSFNYLAFMAATFCCSFGYYGSTNAAFILISEQFGTGWRRMGPGFLICINCLGSIGITQAWQVLHQWRLWMLYATGVPLFASSLLLFFVKESPRYLVNKGRFKEAMEMVLKIAEKNAATTTTTTAMSSSRISEFQFIQEAREIKVRAQIDDTIRKLVARRKVDWNLLGELVTSENIASFSSVNTHTFLSLFRYNSLNVKTMVLIYLWGLFHFANLVSTDIFFNLESARLKETIHQALLVGKITEIIGNLIAVYAAVRIERLKVIKYASAVVILSIAFRRLAIIFGLENVTELFPLLLVKLTCSGVSAFFCVYTCEVFPTSVRHFALGVFISWTQCLDFFLIPLQKLSRFVGLHDGLLILLPFSILAYFLAPQLEETFSCSLADQILQEREMIEQFLGDEYGPGKVAVKSSKF